MKFLQTYKSKNIFWIRFFGVGFCVKKTLSFSERNGYKKPLKIFDYYISIIK